MPFKEVNEEVLYAEAHIAEVAREDIDYLKERVRQNTRKRIRLCLHQSVEDNVHEMFVVLTKEAYIRPHKHLNKPESFYIVEGTVDAAFFDDEGNLVDVVQMGDYRSARRFYYRLPDPLYHAPFVTSDVLVFYEATRGPFNRADTVYAPWAPEENDSGKGREFMRQLEKTIGDFVSAGSPRPSTLVSQ